MKIVLTGGGTGGHVYPALAIAERLRLEPTLQPLECLFIGTRRGYEAKIVPPAGWPIAYVRAAPLARSLSLAIVRTFVDNLIGFVQALRILHRFQPDVAIATGGYVAFPVVLALWFVRTLRLSRARLALLEPNARAGLTNRLLRPLVDEVWLALPDPRQPLRRNERVTGTPVRASFRQPVSAPDARIALGLAADKTTIVAFGGSQGARTLNDAMTTLATRGLPSQWQLLLVTGERDFDGIESRLRVGAPDDVRVVRYLDDPSGAFAAADLVVARAGASTVAELAATATPALLIPYPHATGDHQTENAAIVGASGAARVLADRDLSERTLRAELVAALEPEALRAMRDAARRRAENDPAVLIATRVKAWAPQNSRDP